MGNYLELVVTNMFWYFRVLKNDNTGPSNVISEILETENKIKTENKS